MGIMSEFKAFALRGNVVDMAVGVVIGAAFGKIVSSFVADIIMPPIGLLVGKVSFSDLAVTLREASGHTAAVTLNYGKFIQTAFDFVIIACAIFMAVKAINAMRKAKEAPKEPPAPSREEVLLTEIRDVLKQK